MEQVRKGPILFSKIKPYDALKKALHTGRIDVLTTVRNSNIKGRGGAGFPTGLKWNLAATSSNPLKYVVCNADEGEPGTFKDRVLLTEYAHLMFEGMIIGAFAIGAQKGFLFLRGEYKSFVKDLEKQLTQMRNNGLLGSNILGTKNFNFDIEIQTGVGAYVCGEETALIECLEGNRGESRNRPPYPVNTGYNGSPTIVNNVETFVAIPHIILKGENWFKSFGTEISSGSKLISVSGDCKKPGVYEIPFGTSIKKILGMVKATDTYAVQVGGASGVCLPKSEFNRKIAYEDVPTGGSFIVFNSKRDLLAIAENFLNFFKEESCGQCTPCREGVPVLLEYLEKIKQKTFTETDNTAFLSLCETMQLTSKCGLGQSAPVAFQSILKIKKV